MNKLSYRFSYYVLYAIFAVIVVVLCLFYLGGEGEQIVPKTSNPAHTETLLYLMYGLLGLAVVVTLAAFVAQFSAALKDNPAAALKSLLGVALLAVVVIVAWAMGSEEPLVMTGYTGAENVPFWLKIADMFLYTLYFLVAACVVAIIGSSIKKTLS